MKKLLFLVLTSFVAFSLLAYAPAGSGIYGGEGTLIPVGAELYDYMDALFVSSGLAVPSSSRPWTAGEARAILSRIREDDLSPAQKTLYDRLSALLEKDEGDSLSLTLALSPEVYGHTNSDYNREDQWSYGYVDRNPFLYVALEDSIGRFSGHFEATFGQGMVGKEDLSSAMTMEDYVTSQGHTWTGIGTHVPASEGGSINVLPTQANYTVPFLLNFPSAGNSDINMPRRAYLSYGGDGFSLGIYKAQKVWGINRIGNFLFDEHNDYYDTVSLKTFSDKFGLEYTVYIPEQYRGGRNGVQTYDELTRLFLAHRVEYTFAHKVNLAVSENVMYQTSSVNPALLNLSYFLHNHVNNFQFNAIAQVDVAYTVTKGLLAYTQLVVDQGSVLGFEDPSKEDQAMGVTLGARYVGVGEKGWGTLSLEALMTTPALYRPAGGPAGDPTGGSSDFIINYNHISPTPYYRYPFYTYMGYRYGGDTVAFRLDGDYHQGNLSLTSGLEVVLNGTYTLYDKYSKPLHRTVLSGGCETLVTFSNGVVYEMEAKGFPMKALGNLSFLWSGERGFDAQLTLGLSIGKVLS